MELLLSFAAVFGALTLGAMSPGPSFLFVARTAVAVSRRHALGVALGMGLGAVAFAGLVMVGWQALLLEVPGVYAALKLAGGAYLVWQAIGIWRSAGKPLVLDATGGSATNSSDQRHGSLGAAVLRGFLTQVSNPKTAVVYGGVFAALLPHELPAAAAIFLPVGVFVIEAGWYAIVAFALSASRPRRAYLRSKGVIDRLAGGVLGLLGLKLAWSVRE